MRTTLDLDDDVLRAVRSLARAQNRSLGEVISELARRGFGQRRRVDYRGCFPVFHVAANAPPLTSEMVRQALTA